MTSDEVKIPIEKIGPINEEIDAIVRLSEVLCTVGSEDVDIDIEFDAPANKLMFSVELAPPGARPTSPDARRAPPTVTTEDYECPAAQPSGTHPRLNGLAGEMRKRNRRLQGDGHG
jgi:hypothetical protein